MRNGGKGKRETCALVKQNQWDKARLKINLSFAFETRFVIS